MRIRKVADVETPQYSRDGDCAIDLRASGRWKINLDDLPEDLENDAYDMAPGERVLILTGIQVEIPRGHWGSIRDRSGLAMNGLHVLGGVIDETYRGEIGVLLYNLGKKPYRLEKNERVAQMIIKPYHKANIELANELSDSIRGQQGYGSSGKK